MITKGDTWVGGADKSEAWDEHTNILLYERQIVQESTL